MSSYFERQWVPWWAHVLIFGGGFVFVFVVGRVIIALEHPTARFPLAAQLGVAAGTGLFGLVASFSVMLTTLTVKEGMLRVGGHGFVALEDVEGAAIVRDGEVRRLRGNMEQSLGPGGLLAPLGQLGQAAAGLSVGLAGIKAARRGRGMCVSAWMHEAVVVYAPTSRTKLWLLGTRHPDELLQAIEDSRRGRL